MIPARQTATHPTNAHTRARGDSQGQECPHGDTAPCPPCAVAASETRTVQRVLSLRAALDWSDPTHRSLYQRLRDLGWQAARYRNMILRAKWAKLQGLTAPGISDGDPTKQIRRTQKGELSGDAYSCAEQEVQAVWSREAKRILAGAPLPEWRPDSALSVTGKARRKDSGVWLEHDGRRYVVALRAQSKDCEEGSRLRIPIKLGTIQDEMQGPILERMLRWEIPIKKATVHVEQHGITIKLTYPQQLPPLPPPGQRVAVLGPVGKDGRMMLRTETQTRDYTRRLSLLLQRKQQWDLIRRRVIATMGRGKGHARRKRRALATMTWDDWLTDHLHRWTADCIQWCKSQLVGTIQIADLSGADWPAFKFIQLLRYKAEELGMVVEVGADLSADGAERAAKREIQRRREKAKKLREAITELTHQIKERT